jgi:hypothetical protein
MYGLFEISRVPSKNSMRNLMSQWGGVPGNSSGKNIWEFLNNSNLIKRCSLNLAEHPDLVS